MLTSLRERDKRQKVEERDQTPPIRKTGERWEARGWVAHEINNPLTGIFTFTHMLLRRKDIPEDLRSDIETIAQETEAGA